MLKALSRSLYASAIVVVSSCTTTVVTNQKADPNANTPECGLMKEVCAEARAFQAEWQRMPEQEQKDMAAVLNTYTEHCDQASEKCAASIQNASRDAATEQ